MSIGIYKITSPSDKIYIGQSINIEKRWKFYNSNAVNLKQHIKVYRSIQKYGVSEHKFEIIEECSEELLDEREIYWIKFYNSVEEGLNISEGGYGGNGLLNKGKKRKPETIQKMKDWWSQNKAPRSQETIDKIKKTKRENPRVKTPELVEKYRKASTKKKAVFQYDLEGNFIKEYESINEASRQTGIRVDCISATVRKNQKTAGNYKWDYKNKVE